MQPKERYSHVIWDWNGTLFDDVNWCIKIINIMLAKRGIKTLCGISEYQKAFCFPIIQYYRNVGFNFDKEPFEDLAKEYITLYHSEKSGNCRLYPNTKTVLAAIREKCISQIILSASETSNLLSQISEFNIIGYFDEILGISDIYAKSKIETGLDYISRKKVNRAILIGDTKHDFEVSKALGVDCILIPNGHQNRETLLSCNVPVLEDISYVIDYIKMEL